MNTIADLITKPKLYKKLIAHYQNKNKCAKITNSLIKKNTKSDLRRMK